MNIDIYEMDNEELTAKLNTAMQLTVHNLVSSNLLSPEEAETWLNSHAIMCISKRSLGSWLKEKLFGKEEGAQVRVVEIKAL